ncbi:E3 ubiquitin-protein ligase SINA-like 10 [Pistacia vera]|uniref:E3 ubiquitin-protein ligase SINA-like 10 n=1 Tax=Pistacia vera TaxID=55513 RepID=UPI0012636AD7|nr:E3 ubiquitin-protein ligase SINA-like 10 [Pistacia vera]
MAKFSVGSLDEGEGSSSRYQKRRRMDRQPQTDSTETVSEEIDHVDEETDIRDPDYLVFLSNQEVPFEEEQENDAEDEEEDEDEAGYGVEEGGVNNTSDEEMDDLVVEPGTNESISVTLTDPEVFDCPICYESLSSPVFQCENGHIACSSCCTKIMNKCPSCCLPIGYNRCRAIEKVLESIKVKCRNTKYGCKETTSFSKKLDHAKTCHHAPCSCPMSDCNFVGSCTQLYKHFRDEHENSSVQFQHNKVFQITLNVDDTSLFLQEEKDGVVFILNNRIDCLANSISVCCIAPSTKERFCYDIVAKYGRSIITYQSYTKNIQSRIDNQPSSNILLLPAYSFGHSRQLKLKICIRHHG